jgi:hypothetical protein
MALVHAVGLLSVEGSETSTTVVHDKGMGIETTTIRAMGLGANSVQTVPINLENVSQLKVNLSRMEAVTFISFCFRPKEPPSVSLESSGLIPMPNTLPTTNPPSVSAGQFADNLSPRSNATIVKEHCGVLEKILDQECNMGYYDASNLEVIDSDGSTVSFKLTHSFCSQALSHVLVTD